MDNIIKERWEDVNKLLTSFKVKYAKDSELKKDIQNTLDSLDIEYNDLNKPIKPKEKILLNNAIDSVKNDNLYKGYFRYRIEELATGSINYRDYIEIMLYIAYMKNLSHNIDDIFSLITNAGLVTYNQGRRDLEKETIKKVPTNWLNLIPTLLVGGTMLDTYLQALYLTNTQELQRLIIVNMQAKTRLSASSRAIDELLTKQRNKLINVRYDKESNTIKVSGGLDKYIVAFANDRYIEAGGTENHKVRFIAEMDNKTTDMCKSLDNQIFNTRDTNIFYRYSAIDRRQVKYEVNGLEIGANLPPIDNHFHYCRSTITFLVDKSDKELYNIKDEKNYIERIKHNQIEEKVGYYTEYIRNFPEEHMIVIDDVGNVYHYIGSEANVKANFELIDCIAIHNHPKDQTEYSFSNLDLIYFNRDNMKRFIGTDYKYTYEINRNSKYKEEMPTLDEEEVEDAYLHISNILYSYRYNIGYKRWKNE